ncbi:uncharacterized protein EV420DRAFT_1278222, partial [Desarmillaria tabescens]
EERLYRIIMATSVQLIWSLRCERVIDKQNEPLHPRNTRNKWTRGVNNWLEMDCLQMRQNFGRRALKTQLVERTWEGTLLNEERLPRHWSGVAGVLVGIGP